MKKNYMAPVTNVVELQAEKCILDTSIITLMATGVTSQDSPMESADFQSNVGW